MATIQAIEAFTHLGEYISVSTTDGTTVSGTLNYISATHDGSHAPARITLTIGPHDVHVIGAYQVTVAD